jgi:hypothetical protein
MLNQNFKVMKQNLFKLMMLIAFIAIAGSTYATNDVSVYQGGTYSYSLSGVKVNVAGTVGITFSGFTTPPVISDPSLAGSNPSYTALTTATAFTFKLKYDAGEPAGGGKTITVTATETSSTCSNHINLAITVVAAPTLALTLSSPADFCQDPNGTTDNEDATYLASKKTISYTVTPGTLTGLSSYAFNFRLAAYTFSDITNERSAGTATGGGTATQAALAITAATGNQTFDVKFSPIEGAGATVTAQIPSGTFTMDAAHGGGTYNLSLPSDDNVVILGLPTIGKFE